jgi:hypothetical protein
MGDKGIAKQVYKGRVNKKRMKGRPKKSWLDVVQKCLENKIQGVYQISIIKFPDFSLTPDFFFQTMFLYG